MNKLEQRRVRKLLSRKHDDFRRMFLLFSTRMGIAVATFMFVANCFALGLTHLVTRLIGRFGLLLGVLLRLFSEPAHLKLGSFGRTHHRGL